MCLVVPSHRWCKVSFAGNSTSEPLKRTDEKSCERMLRIAGMFDSFLGIEKSFSAMLMLTREVVCMIFCMPIRATH